MSFLFKTVLIYICFVIFLCIFQRALIYLPDKSRPQIIDGAELARVQTADGLTLDGWYFKGQDIAKPTLVLFHGNAGHYGHRIYKAQYYLREGYGVLLAGYRGYGGNPGSPSEEGFFQDGRAYLDWLVNAQGVSEGHIVLYGESIGSGTAVQMATEYDVAALVLETPFSSLLDVARQQYFFIPVDLLLFDRFLNAEKISDINSPLLIMHGKADSVIPFRFAQKLFDSGNDPKTFVSFPQGRHNDLYRFGAYKNVLDFLSGLRRNIDDNDCGNFCQE